MMDLEEIQQQATDISTADIASFRAKVALAAIAVAAGPGAVAAMSEALVGRYTVQTINRLALLEPLLEQRKDILQPDLNLGVVWLAFKLCQDGDYVDLARFEELLEAAQEEGFSVAKAKKAWGVQESERPGATDLGTGMVTKAHDVGGDILVIVPAKSPRELPAYLARVKVWGDRAE
jgi:hypothetical protein